MVGGWPIDVAIDRYAAEQSHQPGPVALAMPSRRRRRGFGAIRSSSNGLTTGGTDEWQWAGRAGSVVCVQATFCVPQRRLEPRRQSPTRWQCTLWLTGAVKPRELQVFDRWRRRLHTTICIIALSVQQTNDTQQPPTSIYASYWASTDSFLNNIFEDTLYTFIIPL